MNLGNFKTHLLCSDKNVFQPINKITFHTVNFVLFYSSNDLDLTNKPKV